MTRAPAGPARNLRSAAARQPEKQHSHPWSPPDAYVKPKLVAEVKFTEWTAAGEMRHPVCARTSGRRRWCVRRSCPASPAPSVQNHETTAPGDRPRLLCASRLSRLPKTIRRSPRWLRHLFKLTEPTTTARHERGQPVPWSRYRGYCNQLHSDPVAVTEPAPTPPENVK
jgi:hypothetical protein